MADAYRRISMTTENLASDDQKMIFLMHNLVWVKSFRSTIWQMINMPAWTGINVIMGGVIGTFVSIERKKKFFGFMFGTICEKVNE